MASLLYVFPHPDDECFGPVPALAQQRRTGHEVHLLTLTRGEATSQRERLGYSKADMAAARYEEMQGVAATLDLSSLTVLEYPDGGLAELNPLVLEDEVTAHIHAHEPDVVVTYPVHGISGHPDHLVAHAVVKRAVCALRRDGAAAPRRLAFYTLPPADDADRPPHLTHSPPTLIDCQVPIRDEDLETGREALHCYETYRPVIEEHRPLDTIGDRVSFELFAETHDPPLSSLLDRLPALDDEAGLPSAP
ncbi:PIG-L deacetylase family protein [Salinibacter ruber]|jgi:LmbE family N-acetylglucosaminyl deacetylase|uniref:LmbE family N-acetylglucosaminyl deacetylase n=2 Tax=Salinibacter ruber TaxID=146919 RepID=A0A9X2UMM0_9BACT|nr:PIG-L family deacetylase [Salinibacter ruber]MCS3612696.1 LmbE family N-acetylglucosaminyl deacetylase [Salinibacter ruber]MCS3616115.1 LmbE family N-acetylglucosaminyl deacetylase [Salinibacter ruber]MCS3635460.1 LmbE family N-acetylglucosaminyl deacetylase [Salinibacter ruber]MCS3648042.1 LmbE family N-acetylglucosaminyl deacetylase [Salinibacter ruber]MCS3657201.1 LmbE family N-acetylglucosaminyl deacetylase [Salinibacter ruber]